MSFGWKRELYAEVFSMLEPGGVFCNLEHVSSPSQRIHDRFVQAMGMKPEDEDPSNWLPWRKRDSWINAFIR